MYPTTQGTLLQKYVETLVARLSPSSDETLTFSKSHSLSSMKDFTAVGVGSGHSMPAATAILRRSSQAIPPSHQHTGSGPSPDGSALDDEDGDPEETEL